MTEAEIDREIEKLPPEYVKACDRWRSHWHNVIAGNAAVVLAGDEDQISLRAKSAGATAAMIYYAIRFMIVTNPGRSAEQHIEMFNSYIHPYVDQVIADLATEAMAEQATAPTTDTPQ